MVTPRADEFESATENSALVELLRRRIDAEGPITFRDYMETVLYHPRLGYYATREPMGASGDYLTSPEVSPIFGAMVAKQLEQCWELLGQPGRFEIVEQGAGRGLLALDILRWLRAQRPEAFEAARYRIVEVSASLRERQREALARLTADGAGAPVEWLDTLPDGIEGCVLSNELLDSFPVHRVVNRDAELRELYVSHDGDGFVQTEGPPSTDRLASYFDALGLFPGDGCAAEVNLQAIEWMRRAARSLRRGYALTFDYGYEAGELYASWRRDGTLLCFHRHNANNDPYARVGRQDITSHIDFTTLTREGEAAGLETAGFTTQARFLSTLGIGEAVGGVAQETPAALEEYYARRRAVQELIDPAGLGRIRVLAQRKGVPPEPLQGFENGYA
jgi:SAM-dependent MidA family methyltransferase